MSACKLFIVEFYTSFGSVLFVVICSNNTNQTFIRIPFRRGTVLHLRMWYLRDIKYVPHRDLSVQHANSFNLLMKISYYFS